MVAGHVGLPAVVAFEKVAAGLEFFLSHEYGPEFSVRSSLAQEASAGDMGDVWPGHSRM